MLVQFLIGLAIWIPASAERVWCSHDTPCKGRNVCNFDNIESGFCESCIGKLTAWGCQKSNFIQQAGFEECVRVCAYGINPFGYEWEGKEVHHEPMTFLPRPDLFTPGKCSSSLDCDNGRNMCNFDNGSNGFCERCSYFQSAESCRATGFITRLGFENCLEFCNNGFNPNEIQWLEIENDDGDSDEEDSYGDGVPDDEDSYGDGDSDEEDSYGDGVPDDEDSYGDGDSDEEDSDDGQCGDCGDDGDSDDDGGYIGRGCVSSNECGGNMCDFKYGNSAGVYSGLCKDCSYFRSAEACKAYGFDSERGYNECLKVCVGL